jgi:hypothetical protein
VITDPVFFHKVVFVPAESCQSLYQQSPTAGSQENWYPVYKIHFWVYLIWPEKAKRRIKMTPLMKLRFMHTILTCHSDVE